MKVSSILAVISLFNFGSVALGNELTDYAIQDVCVDGANRPIVGDPANCKRHRDLQPGEKVPYLRTDLDYANGNQTYQALFSIPVWGTDGNIKSLTMKSNLGGFNSSFTFPPYDMHRDGYDLMDLGSPFSFIRTADGGCLDQLISGANGRSQGWILFGSGGGRQVHAITIKRISPDRPADCAATSHGSGAMDIWNAPTPIKFESGRTLNSIVTYHFAQENLSAKNNALERYYFTKEYGFTRWESWIPVSRCTDASFDGSPAQAGRADETCDPSSAKYFLRGRCSKENIPALDQWGGQSWVRVDCRDSSHYVALTTPVMPLDSTMGNTNAVLDVDYNRTIGSSTPDEGLTPNPQPGQPSPPATIPNGSYLQSCSGCQVSGSILQCKCKDKTGYIATTRIDLHACHGEAPVNINGQLACGGGGAHSLP
jgi:hypothetical protein